jgi:signal transduction histidine kinase
VILKQPSKEKSDLILDRIKGLSYTSRDLSHAMRNGLSIINNAAEVIRMRLKSEDPKIARCLQVIKEEVQKGEQTLETLSLLDSVTKTLKKFPVRLNEVIENALMNFDQELKDKTIQVIRNFPEFPPLLLDRWQMGRALEALMKNAVEAMEQGGILELKGRITNQGFFLEIKDSGCGMDQTDREKVFDPFFSTKEKRMGLGLPIAYAAVKNLDGEMTVESQPGKGTCVILEIPREAEIREEENS